MITMRNLKILTAVLAAVVAITATRPAEARLRERREVAKAAAAAAVLGGDPSCCAPAPAPVCCPPKICYRDKTRCNPCCDPCAPKIQDVLTVCDPCTGCPVQVPVCLPGCCTGCPEVCARGALFGRGVVTYRWCCGFTATVRFDRCGDVLVTYR